MNKNVNSGAAVRLDAHAVRPEHLSMDQFVELLQTLGNTVLEVDHEGDRVLLMRENIEHIGG